jgi:HD-like signal output (HDOD) protein
MDVSQQPHSPALPKVISNLPPFPAVALRAMRMASTSDERLRDLHDLICTDPVFSAEILKFANSPLYGISSEIKNTLQATILLGYERVRGLVLTIGMRAYLRPAQELPALRACWLHSLACAMVAEEFAAVCEIDKDLAYTAGVVHDIGRLALIATHPRQYPEVLNGAGHRPVELMQRERELFGMDHCQAGHSLIAAWNLPVDFLDVTSKHHQRRSDGTFDLLAVIASSCEMADALGFGLVPPASSRSCDEILGEVPEHERLYLPTRSAELAARIAAKINCIESM